jgi:hypothetical protein
MIKRSFIHAMGIIFLSLILSYSPSWAETKPVLCHPLPRSDLYSRLYPKESRSTLESLKRRFSPSRRE